MTPPPRSKAAAPITATPSPKAEHKAEAVYLNGALVDITVHRNGRALTMLGAGGNARECAILPEPEALFPPEHGDITAQTFLPVVIGSGTGAALEKLIGLLAEKYGADFLLAVVDKETDILAASRVRERFAAYPGILWLPAGQKQDAAANNSHEAIAAQSVPDVAATISPAATNSAATNSATTGTPLHAPDAELSPDAVLFALTRWQTLHGGRPFLPITNPFYLRIDRTYYAAVRESCEASHKIDFWRQAQYPRFSSGPPRLLLLTSSYFLIGEIVAACERLGYPTYLIEIPEKEVGSGAFIESILHAVVEFKPDFAFTINHLGVDREGILTSLLEKLRLPLASWFVDNPHLILYLFNNLVNPWTTLFTWDADNTESLRALGFEHVFYLPLGVDTHRFTPDKSKEPLPFTVPQGWNRQVSFIGNSMVSKVYSRKHNIVFPPELDASYIETATAFAASDHRLVGEFLGAERLAGRSTVPDAFDALPTIKAKLDYETMLTWEATRQYRLSCVQGILPFAPLIAGDAGWKTLLGGHTWHYRSELTYYDGVPRFYPLAHINFNCTSKQMKGAVNQRVFDVPATGSFLLTDYREQVENLFEPGSEIICYHSPEEAEELARQYLAKPNERAAVAKRARTRILAEHTYEHRVKKLVAAMRKIYA